MIIILYYHSFLLFASYFSQFCVVYGQQYKKICIVNYMRMKEISVNATERDMNG